MNRRNPPAKWVLPTVVNPPEKLCFTIEVPNERFHLAAFRGALLSLASAYKWADDPDHTARLVANVWKEIVVNVRACPVPVDRDGVEFDGEELMGSLCEALRFHNGKLQAYCCGEWVDIDGQTGVIAGGVEQEIGTSGPLAPGECATYEVSLGADQKYLLPVPVSVGDIITISNVSGGWNDGTLLWFCPQGFTYAAGLCVSLAPAASGDPLQTVGHMRLIAGYDTASPVFTDAYNGTIVMPSGTSDEQLWFQANDSTLAGNSGRISFTVQVCAAASTVTYDEVYDFTIDEQGWDAYPTYNTTYEAASGWRGGCDQAGVDSFQQAVIQLEATGPGRVEEVIVTFDRTYSGFNDGYIGVLVAKNFVPGGGGVAIGSASSMASGTGTVVTINSNPVDVVAGDKITVIVASGYLHARGDCSSFGSGTELVTSVEIKGPGTSPF